MIQEGVSMTKQEFAAWTAENNIYLDGATGSNLMKAGMPAGVCPEQWILEHPQVMRRLQEDYVKSGSNILYAPTFTANRIKLSEYGLADKLCEMISKLVDISKQAADGRAYIAGDITMTGEQLSPIGTLDFEELIEVYKEQIDALVNAGVDMLIVETMMSLQETRAALIAAKESCELPVMVTMTFEGDGRTLFGTDALTAAVVLESLGADAIGANCSTGPAAMSGIIKAMSDAVSIPVIAKPNAGLPFVDKDGNTCYDMDAETFAEEMKLLADAGASILGGCCGTTPEYIKRIKTALGTVRTPHKPKDQDEKCLRYLSSERQTVSFSLEDNFIVVGERINPTGKKKLQEALRAGSLDMVKEFAEEQEACGAHILDVNMGMGGIDEKEMMLKAIEEISTVTNLPLSLDSSHIAVLEEALRRYPGRALVNSVSYEKEKFEKLLPIVKKYGAMFILLPLSDDGLPADLEEKKDIIHKIWERAEALGFRKEDIVVDGLVNTVGANKNAAVDTLETIRYCKDTGFATVCGLSNISFGMPERSYVNTAFLTMAIQSGLTMAIANPSQELLMGCAFASDLLLNKEDADMKYIAYSDVIKERRLKKEQEMQKAALTAGVGVSENTKQETAAAGTDPTSDLSPEKQKLREAVLKGNKKGIVQLTKEALATGTEPKELLDAVLLPAINTVGDYFDSGKYFLPQLIAGAEAMKLSIEVLEPLMLKEQSGEDMPVIIIATVEGDIHDIGKNLVALMLKNYGFKVIDLGKDVPKEKIIEAAKEYHASIIALSALMTTTMKQMEAVINYAREQGVTAKIMVGGAVITEEYAQEIGADGYSKDAAEAVKLAGRLLGQLR